MFSIIKKIFDTVWNVPKNIAIFFIIIYQKTISPDHGLLKFLYPHGFCKFNPSCSQYGRESFQKKGFLKGAVHTIKRIARCNPWNKGGDDPVK